MTTEAINPAPVLTLVETVQADVAAVVTEIKNQAAAAVTGFKSMVEESAVLWLQDFIRGSQHAVTDRIEHTVEYVELLSKRATLPLGKEDTALELLLPQVLTIVRPAFGDGVVARVTENFVLPRIKNGLRGLIRVAVDLRNRIHGQSWVEVVHDHLQAFGYSLESRFNFDADSDGWIGDPRLEIRATPPAGGAAVPMEAPPLAGHTLGVVATP